MSDNVVKMYPSTYSDNPDNVLHEAVGNYEDVLILGWDKEGKLDVRATKGLSSAQEIVWMIESFKHRVLDEIYHSD